LLIHLPSDQPGSAGKEALEPPIGK
jgi:hypothetical protein